MIFGVILIIIAVLSFYWVHKTDLEDVTVEGNSDLEEAENRIYVHLGILLLLIIGIVSIVKHYL